MAESAKRCVRWGIIGSGAAAQRFCDGLSKVPDAKAEAIWSRNPQTTKSLATYIGASPCESLDRLLSSQIDAVYIATLPDSHAAYATAALKAGKPVLCEKPAMLNGAELEEVLAVARQHDLLFMEAMKPPFFPLYRGLCRQLEEDPIGPIGYVRAGHAIADVPQEHPSWKPETGGGSLLGIGVYHAFLAADWMGPARDVQALGQMSEGGVDSFACVQTSHASGFAQLYSGLALAGPGDALLAAGGGYVTIREKWWNPTSATVHYREGRVVELVEPITGSGFNYETDHFCELLRNGDRESPVMTHERSRQVMQILDRAGLAIGSRLRISST